MDKSTPVDLVSFQIANLFVWVFLAIIAHKLSRIVELLESGPKREVKEDGE